MTKDVLPYELWTGVPTKRVGWMTEFGERMDFLGKDSGVFRCKHSGIEYHLKNQRIVSI